MDFGSERKNIEIGQTLTVGQSFDLDMKVSHKQNAVVTKPTFLLEARWKL